MNKLFGLAVAAATLSACGNSSGNEVITTPDIPVVEPETPETPTEVVDTPTDGTVVPPSPGEAADPKNLPRAQPPEAEAPVDPFADLNPPVVPTVRTTASGDVGTASFDADAGTLTVQIALDGNDILQEYAPDGTLGGYARFTIQDDPLDREFKGFAAETDNGDLQAVVVLDGGQFNRFFGGGAVQQTGYTAAPAGLASFAGGYVGLTNVGSLLATGNGADLSLVPGSTTQITGEVFLNVDFTDGYVNGSIYDRVYDPESVTPIDLQTIILTATDFGEDGQFSGAVELLDLENVGTYEGAFGGEEASSIAGVISLGDGFLEDATINGNPTLVFDDVENETEFGLFLNERCQAGNAGCFDAN